MIKGAISALDSPPRIHRYMPTPPSDVCINQHAIHLSMIIHPSGLGRTSISIRSGQSTPLPQAHRQYTHRGDTWMDASHTHIRTCLPPFASLCLQQLMSVGRAEAEPGWDHDCVGEAGYWRRGARTSRGRQRDPWQRQVRSSSSVWVPKNMSTSKNANRIHRPSRVSPSSSQSRTNTRAARNHTAHDPSVPLVRLSPSAAVYLLARAPCLALGGTNGVFRPCVSISLSVCVSVCVLSLGHKRQGIGPDGLAVSRQLLGHRDADPLLPPGGGQVIISILIPRQAAPHTQAHTAHRR